MQYPEGQRPRTSLLLELLKFVTRTGINHRCFLKENVLGTTSSWKVSGNYLWWSHFLIKTQDRDSSQQPKTLLYPITDVLQECFKTSFEIAAPKTFENTKQNVYSGVSFG